jgi:hypothetical protein
MFFESQNLYAMITLMARKSNQRHIRNRLPFLLSPGWLTFGMLFIGIVVMLVAVGKRGYYATSKTNAPPQPDSGNFGSTLTRETYTKWTIADLSDKLKVDATQIAVRSVEEKIWTSSALGCPKRGMMYAQVMTPGYLITLSNQGRDYQYHAGSQSIVYCNR